MRKLALLALTALTASLAPAPALASNPPAQQVTVPSTAGGTATITWTGTIPPGVNPASDCDSGLSPEDHHTVDISVPAGLYDTLSANATFSIAWTPSSGDEVTSDEILTVYGPDSQEIDSSDGGTPSESVAVKDPAAGTYDAVACGFSNLAPQDYAGTLTITTAAGQLVPPGCPGGTGPAAPKAKRPKGVLRDVQAGIDCLAPLTSEQQADTTIEPSIAVNPADPLNAVATYQEGRVDSGCAEAIGFATTTDGGQSWAFGDLPGLTEATGNQEVPLASDPVAAFGPNDHVYINTLPCLADGTDDLALSVSTDGGLTWGDAKFFHVNEELPSTDKNWIVVDNSSAPGHHLGRIYVAWDNIAPVVAAYSDDEGDTWQGPFLLYPGQGIGTIPLVMPNGDLAVVFSTLTHPVPPVHGNPADYEGEVFAAIDHQVISVAPGAGSLPTGAPLVFTPPTGVGAADAQDVRRQRAGEGLPTAGVDPNTGRIYVAWESGRFRTDLANDIVVTSSDDEGVTWSPVTRVNPGPPDDYVDRFTPALGVGPDGAVRIAYRVQYEAPEGADFSPYVDTFLQTSTDGGETFSAPLKVNSVRTDVRFAAFSRASAFLGDYSQVAITGSWTYIVRCEAFALSRREPATFPPTVHHQRTWVALVDTDGNGSP